MVKLRLDTGNTTNAVLLFVTSKQKFNRKPPAKSNMPTSRKHLIFDEL